MPRNIGPEDRVVRIVVGIGLLVIAYLGFLGSIASIIAAIVGAYLLLTGIVVRCLFYKVADIDTSIQEQPYSTTDDRAGL